MLTSIRSLLAATAFVGGIAVAAPALAQDAAAPTPEFTVSGNVSGVSDYRFRGVSLSQGDPAIQGGITLTHASGFYVGAWSSSLGYTPLYGEQELDLFGGWGGEVAPGTKVDVGLLKYIYPGNDVGPADYWEPYASISHTFGPVTAKVGGAYAWEQDSLGGGDNLYVYTNLDLGLPNLPVTISGHVGYTDGVLAPPLLSGLSTKDTGFDWSLGATTTVLGHLTLGLAYVGVDGPAVDGLTDDTLVGSITLAL